MSEPASSTMATRAPMQAGVVALGLVLALALGGAVAASADAPLRPLLRVGVGLALGATLLATDFGFAGAFRRVVVERDLAGIRAHLFTFGLAVAIVVPMIAAGRVLGQDVEGFSHGVGVTFLTGGLVFGTGMQLAGGCASGTLYQLGGGATKHVGTVIGFVVGSVIAASHLSRWWGLPALPAVTVLSFEAWPRAWLALLALIGLGFVLLRRHEIPRRLFVGGALLALLEAATVLVSGRPWSETWAFTIWGAQIASRLGAHPETWRVFENAPWRTSPFVDGTSIMDLAMPLGALIAAGALGRFELRRVPPRVWLLAVAGGTLMGYGARLSGGCNIGAYFSTIASGDPSGWAWAIAATAGSVVGIRVRARIEG